MFFYDTYAIVAGMSILVIIIGAVGLALVLTWISGHKFGKHEDLKMGLLVTAALSGTFLAAFLLFRLTLP